MSLSVIDLLSQDSDMTITSTFVFLAQIYTISNLGNRLRTFKCIKPNPDLDLNSSGVVKFEAMWGPGFGDTFPDINNINTIKLLRLTELLTLNLVVGPK